MASTTKTFLKQRAAAGDPVKAGQWHAGFSKMKKYAEEQNIPFIAVWSNGDVCGHCTAFENSCMQSEFTSWMKTSGCAFWFGCSSDTSADDKLNGTGYKWAWADGKINLYPFVRVYWKAGKVDQCKSGKDWTGGTSKGGGTFVKKLKSLLKDFKPDSGNANIQPADPAPVSEVQTSDSQTCDGDGCQVKPTLEDQASEANKELSKNGVTGKFLELLTAILNTLKLIIK